MGILNDLNIVKGNNTKVGLLFEELFPSFVNIEYEHPKDYVNHCWNSYLEVRESKFPNEQGRRSANGKMFEYILATLLIREEIFPIFMSASVAFVPNIKYDLLLYSVSKGPICLSAKTSFRERYKQADLEAIALKYVHRRSLSYLITLSEKDADDVNEKQSKGEIIGLEKAIYALREDFDELISNLKNLNLTESPTFNVIKSNQIINEQTIQSALG